MPDVPPDRRRTPAALPAQAPAKPPAPVHPAPPRRPSWLRAALISLIIVAAGVVLGAAGYHWERTRTVQLPSVKHTGDVWRLSAHRGHELSGLALNGTRLMWRDGASVEFLDLRKGEVHLLGPGPGMHITWDPAVGDRYAVWFEAERSMSFAATMVAYDTRSGRRWTLDDVGSVRSYPSISSDVGVWCSARQIGVPTINAVRVGSGESFEIAPQAGAPVISGNLVVWALDWTGPFVASDTVRGPSWPVAARLSAGRLTGIALGGRTLVWGQATAGRGSGVVSACDVDGGATLTIASKLTNLTGPAFDGHTIVWATQQGGRSVVMGRRLRNGPAFVIADVDDSVSEVAVSRDLVAWIQPPDDAAIGAGSIVVRRLPR